MTILTAEQFRLKTTQETVLISRKQIFRNQNSYPVIPKTSKCSNMFQNKSKWNNKSTKLKNNTSKKNNQVCARAVNWTDDNRNDKS